uniref:Uncharacterized protein n=1 Tax=Chromera velia CCMP2878 TaxID=1169474 RepID=A0A0G4I481_9ALVE|eukprot:Cvel_1775.t1-p1 / transcript=Cvel_1775.t1 / gene=Cvel_1775 / organism=Chromera_velia_CCMP2878 / gene_product=Serine/threonine-protein phosphatase 6 regulatory, putative / transcript_product=Serine/threonine-protein phosphatase 6 regulatory, putative / location=Cvel_scaffold65:50924-52210(-) / protein_length=429 / sequence_SO=supercontig / SO=protein_coding / is_pseudo=false
MGSCTSVSERPSAETETALLRNGEKNQSASLAPSAGEGSGSRKVQMELLVPLWRLPVGRVIRSFGAVSAEVLRSSLEAFIKRGERGDLFLVLFIGAHVDGLVEGMTALHRAIAAQNMEAVRLLVDAGAGLNVEGVTRFWPGNLPRPFEPSQHSKFVALHLACSLNQSEIGKFLLLRGANMKANVNETDQVDGFVEPLHIAAARGMTDLVLSLLLHGADVHAKDEYGFTALHRAVEQGRAETAKLLLDRGARVSDKDKRGDTPLLRAASERQCGGRQSFDHREVAELLVSRGADVNAKGAMGRTVLHRAAYWGFVDIVEVLLHFGVDVHVVDGWGRTALHSAVVTPYIYIAEGMRTRGSLLFDKKLRIARMLVFHGIDANAVNNDGKTALAIAGRELPIFPANRPMRNYLAHLAAPQQQQQQQQHMCAMQ